MSKRTIAPGSAVRETKRAGKVLKVDRILTPASMQIVPANLTRETPMPPPQDISAASAAPLHLDSAKPTPAPPPPQADSRRRLLPLAALTVGLVVAIAGLLVLQSTGGDSARAAARNPAQIGAASEPARATPAVAPAATPAPSAGSWEANLVAEITSGTLAALRGEPAGDVSADKAAVIAVVETALHEGQTIDAIDQMVNDAVDAKRITVPDTLIGADGRVDITAIVSTIAKTE